MSSALGKERRDFLFKNTASCLSIVIDPEWAEVVRLHNLFPLLMSDFAFASLIFADRLSQFMQWEVLVWAYAKSLLEDKVSSVKRQVYSMNSYRCCLAKQYCGLQSFWRMAKKLEETIRNRKSLVSWTWFKISSKRITSLRFGSAGSAITWPRSNTAAKM